MLQKELTHRILVTFFEVYNEVGRGFLESVYAESLRMALADYGLRAEREVPVNVLFRGRIAGRYFADLVVERSVILEIKVTRTLVPAHEAQLVHYLRATDMEVGMLLNFGQAAQFKRLVYSNERKHALRSNRPA